MNALRTSIRTSSTRLNAGAVLLGVAALLAMGSASAQDINGNMQDTTPAQALSTTGADTTGSYHSEQTSCVQGMTQQAEDTCLREARNAEADKRRGVLETDSTDYAATRSARCNVFTMGGEERAACVARIDGECDAAGTVAQGGVLREVETVVLPAGSDRVRINAQTSNPVILVPVRNTY